MGRNSNDSTAFYEGLIDSFKMVKYPGGNTQSPPDIEGPSEGHPDQEYSYNFTVDDTEEENDETSPSGAQPEIRPEPSLSAQVDSGEQQG